MDEQNKFDLENESETAENTASRTIRRSAPPSDAPKRRVGSLTLGFCLIAAGIFFLCYYFVPGFDWQLTLRIAPAAALILLGSEVLFFASRPGRWKYDFMSVFVCLVLIAGCFCLSFVPVVWSEIDPARQQNAAKLSQEYTDEVCRTFRKDAPDVPLRDVYTDLYLYTNAVETLDALEPGNGQLSLHVELFGPYDSAEAFAQDCRRLTDSLQKQGVQPDAVSFECDAFLSDDAVRRGLDSGSLQQTQDYRLELYGTPQLDWTADQMARETDVTDLLDEENLPEEDAAEDASSAEESSVTIVV